MPPKPIVDHKKRLEMNNDDNLEYGYFKFGRPGAGAPIRDRTGKAVTSRSAGLYDTMINDDNVDVNVYEDEQINKDQRVQDHKLNNSFVSDENWSHKRLLEPPGGFSHFKIGGMSPIKDNHQKKY